MSPGLSHININSKKHGIQAPALQAHKIRLAGRRPGGQNKPQRSGEHSGYEGRISLEGRGERGEREPVSVWRGRWEAGGMIVY